MFVANSYKTPWRNGSASDSRSEGCVFKSRRGQKRRSKALKKLTFLMVDIIAKDNRSIIKYNIYT